MGIVQATNIAAEGFCVESSGFGYVLHIQNRVGKNWTKVGGHFRPQKTQSWFLIFDVNIIVDLFQITVTKSMQYAAKLPRSLLKRYVLSYACALSCLGSYTCHSCMLLAVYMLPRGG